MAAVAIVENFVEAKLTPIGEISTGFLGGYVTDTIIRSYYRF